MANLTYRETSSATVIASTTVAGVPLTNHQVDQNFKSLNDDLALKATSAALSAAVAPLATSAALSAAVAPLATSASVTTALSSYATTSAVSAADSDTLSAAMAYAIALG